MSMDQTPIRSQSFIHEVLDERSLGHMIGDLELNLYNRRQQILQNSADVERLKKLKVVLDRDKDLLSLGVLQTTYTDVYEI